MIMIAEDPVSLVVPIDENAKTIQNTKRHTHTNENRKCQKRHLTLGIDGDVLCVCVRALNKILTFQMIIS